MILDDLLGDTVQELEAKESQKEAAEEGRYDAGLAHAREPALTKYNRWRLVVHYFTH